MHDSFAAVKVAESAVDEHIDFLGFRKDIGQLIALSDIGISASRQEGLGLNLAEEMYCGIPVVASEDRGHKELIIQNRNGILFPQMDREAFIGAVVALASDSVLRVRMSEFAKESMQRFVLKNALIEMTKIYQSYLYE